MTNCSTVIWFGCGGADGDSHVTVAWFGCSEADGDSLGCGGVAVTA